jgi:3-hydroxyisobutyrate dehydrogenase-like beta-hydroxyacid dehydrogenase
MAQLGFLGLGIMGYPMARHLLKAGNEVALWTHSPAKAKKLAEESPEWKDRAVVCATPREVSSRADFIFYCVGDTAMSRTVALGPNGILEGARPDSVTADCSSISPVVSQEIAAAFTAKGAHFLDAPCTGSKPGATNAALTFMVGGDEAVYERTKPYFEIMGKRLYHCGPSGRGLYAKLTQNLILANLMEAFAEGMVLATKNGVKPEMMLDILDNSAAKSGLVSFKAPFVMARDFSTNFSTKWLHKDVGLALETAKAADLPLPLTAVTEQMLRATIAKGWGDDDFCSVIRILEEWAGIEVRS